MKCVFLVLLCFIFGCSNNSDRGMFNRQMVTSIGPENLTLKKPINIIVYGESSSAQAEANFEKGAELILRSVKSLDEKKLIKLNRAVIHKGAWETTANKHFDKTEYNWIIRIEDSELPRVAFQNFSDDIDSSKEVHYRFCKERMIQFSDVDQATIRKDISRWRRALYPAAIESLYLLMQGNTRLTLNPITTSSGKPITGTLLGESERYQFVLDGEEYIYIAPKIL